MDLQRRAECELEVARLQLGGRRRPELEKAIAAVEAATLEELPRALRWLQDRMYAVSIELYLWPDEPLGEDELFKVRE